MKKADLTTKQNDAAASRNAAIKTHRFSGRKPEIFLASSSESVEILHKIAELIKTCGGKPLLWTEAFPVGEFQLESLLKTSRKVDGALVLACADDKLLRRGEPAWTPRDNIVFEMGLFVSALSPSRVALVSVKSGKAKPIFPTDLAGLTYLHYDVKKPEQNEEHIRRWMSSFFVQPLHGDLPLPKGGKYTWLEVDKGLEYIQNKMSRDAFIPNAILGLGRSGGVVGGILASLLGSIPLRLWDIHYSKGKHSVAVEFQGNQPLFPPKTKRVLVIEGATTGGQTPKMAMELLQLKFPDIEFRFAVLIQSVQSFFTADYCAYRETEALKPLPWHGPLSRTFLKPVDEKTETRSSENSEL
jgi:predicted nucleotide-binding protein/hypoxanthine phosphoribosyltransferase